MILCSDSIFSAAEIFLFGHIFRNMLLSFSIQCEKYLSFFLSSAPGGTFVTILAAVRSQFHIISFSFKLFYLIQLKPYRIQIPS
jgi:hypothetical protein